MRRSALTLLGALAVALCGCATASPAERWSETVERVLTLEGAQVDVTLNVSAPDEGQQFEDPRWRSPLQQPVHR